MEENFIYDDLAAQGDLGDIIHDLQKRKSQLELHVASLEEDVKKLCDKITEMKAVQDNLSRNISELFKTAKNELNRKDRRIAELQKQLDDLVFRRNTTQSNFGYKRKRDDLNREECNKKFKNEAVEVVSVRNVSDDPANTGTDQNSSRDYKKMIERVNPETNFHDTSRLGSDHGGRTSYSRENSSKRERSTHKEDSHKNMIERVDPDHSFQHQSNRSDKNSYSRDDSGRRDRKDDPRDKRDSYRDLRGHLDSRTDNRDNRVSRRDHRDLDREHKDFHRGYRDNNKGRRDKSRDHRNNQSNYKGSYREYKDQQRDLKDARLEDTKRTSDCQKNERNESNNFKRDNLDDFNYLGDEQMDLDPRKEPIFSESSKSLSEGCLDKEEGELSDEVSSTRNIQENRVEHPNTEYFKNRRENRDGQRSNQEIVKSRNNRIDVQNMDKVDGSKILKNALEGKTVRDTHFMERKVSNIEEPKKCTQKNLNQQKELKELSNKRVTKDPSKSIKSTQENDNRCTKKNAEKCRENDKKKLPNEEHSRGKVESTKDDPQDDTETNNMNVNIISQVILHKGQKEASACSENKPEAKHKSADNKIKPAIIVPKLDKPRRESRVPRNLNEELELDKKLERSEKTQELMTQLFGSSEKRSSSKCFDYFSPTHSVALSHDGEIPNLPHLSSPDPRDIKQNFQSSTPVTEFQIFKTNLPSLEKSNSLPSIAVQIQTPDNSTRSKEDRVEKPDTVQESAKPKETSEKLVSKQGPVSTQDENVPQSSSDVCNLSFDLFNMDIGQYKAEDFPNLIAHSEFRDMSDLLLTPVNTAVKNVPRTKDMNNPKPSNILNENENETLNAKQGIEHASQEELNGHPKNADRKENTKESVSDDNISKVSKKSSNVSKNNKDKTQNVANKIEKPSVEIVSKLPKKSTSKKENKTNSNKKPQDNVIVGVKGHNDPEKLKKIGESSGLEKKDTVIKTVVPKIISDKVENSVRETTRSRKQTRTNVNRKSREESVTESSEKLVDTSNKEENVNMESTENTLNSSNETKSRSNSNNRRKRCVMQWL